MQRKIARNSKRKVDEWVRRLSGCWRGRQRGSGLERQRIRWKQKYYGSGTTCGQDKKNFRNEGERPPCVSISRRRYKHLVPKRTYIIIAVPLVIIKHVYHIVGAMSHGKFIYLATVLATNTAERKAAGL